MSLSSKLYRLQQIDTLYDQTLARLEELENLLGDRSSLEQAEEAYKKADGNLQAERRKLLQAEGNVREQRIKIEQEESALYSGKMRNPKELQELQNEVAALKRYLTTLEDRLLEAMIATEEAEKATDEAKASVDKAQAQMIERNAHLNAEKSNLLKDKERLELERRAACSAISSEELDLYHQLRQTRRGIAVAIVINRTCSACGSTLTPALVQAANSPNQIIRCSSCNRILYPG